MPNTPTKRQQQAEFTKLRIFNTAVGLLAKKSFEDITIRDIVAGAGVSVGTFYNYYATKTDVFYQAYSVADRYFAETVAPCLQSGSATERVFLFFDFYARYNTDISGFKLSKLLYSVDNPCFNRDGKGGMAETLTAVLKYGIESGELESRGDTVEEMEQFLMTSVRGLVCNWCSASGAFDLRVRTRAFTARLMRAYAKQAD